ncbi:nitroreductase family protein [Paenibacillus sp. MWE-103]|uniref:Nitroreductase family protein n=2 Tax=Paenibacillus artemisiicola TaxID=1172618 RepID=A0ABS3WH17_9BACL|nr:nitroreductase family protein [Paenibacillus artemisiicola]MBO7747445.1 nitroreductase family protein [Paenibacillus artemisiicola]
MRSMSFAEIVKGRRSIRKLTNSPEVPRAAVEDVVRNALHAPSAFNMQSGRLVVLTGANHAKLWDLVTETLRAHVPAEKFGATQDRMNGFKGGAGTVLFFEDETTVKAMQAKSSPSYQMHFHNWSHQGSALLQYAVWLGLTEQGLGASLQHYNPIIDDQVKAEWDVPASWTLIAQMPFGRPAETPGDRSFLPYEDVVKWH